jgi:hypothetical protein
MTSGTNYVLVKYVICVLPLVGNSINSNQRRIGNTYILPTNGRSAIGRWAGKRSTDTTYPNHSGGSVNVFTDRWRIGKATFTDPPLVAINEPWCSGMIFLLE